MQRDVMSVHRSFKHKNDRVSYIVYRGQHCPDENTVGDPGDLFVLGDQVWMRDVDKWVVYVVTLLPRDRARHPVYKDRVLNLEEDGLCRWLTLGAFRSSRYRSNHAPAMPVEQTGSTNLSPRQVFRTAGCRSSLASGSRTGGGRSVSASVAPVPPAVSAGLSSSSKSLVQQRCERKSLSTRSL